MKITPLRMSQNTTTNINQNSPAVKSGAQNIEAMQVQIYKTVNLNWNTEISQTFIFTVAIYDDSEVGCNPEYNAEILSATDFFGVTHSSHSVPLSATDTLEIENEAIEQYKKKAAEIVVASYEAIHYGC